MQLTLNILDSLKPWEVTAILGKHVEGLPLLRMRQRDSPCGQIGVGGALSCQNLRVLLRLRVAGSLAAALSELGIKCNKVPEGKGGPPDCSGLYILNA